MENKARVRIYSLESKGLSFSYSTDSSMVVVGGRYDDKNSKGLKYEMELMGFQYIESLVIPDWRSYFCKPSELKCLLEELQPDEIYYPEAIPNEEYGKASLQRVGAYRESDLSFERTRTNNMVGKSFFISDKSEVMVCYLNMGDLSVGFFSQCKTEEEKTFVLDKLKDCNVDVLIGGSDYINEGLSKQIVDEINPHTVVGKQSPALKSNTLQSDSNSSKIIHVTTNDVFISKVKDEIVRLRVGNDQLTEI